LASAEHAGNPAEREWTTSLGVKAAPLNLAHFGR
jgi:hypothetical protein